VKPPAAVRMGFPNWCLHQVHFRENKCLPIKLKRSGRSRHVDLEETVCKAARGSLYTNDPGLVPLTRIHWRRAVSNQSAEQGKDNVELRIERSGIAILMSKQLLRIVPLLLADLAYTSSDDSSTRFVVGIAPSGGDESAIWLFEVGPCSFPDLQLLLGQLGSKGALRGDLDDCFSISTTVLGTGGCGKVYLGRSRWNLPPVSGNSVTAGGPVALKEIAPRQIPIEQLVRSEIGFLTEVHGHPNVAALYGVFCSRKKQPCQATDGQDSGQDEGRDRWLIALELYSGGDLFEHVLKHGAMREADAAEVMLGLLSALAHVHSLGIVHRDVKCENILIADARAVLADFGIAASLADAGAMDKRVGSPGYAAPEVLMGEPYDEKIDVFAAGVVLYYCLSAVLPFADSSVERILARTVRCKVRMDRERFAGFSGGIVKLTKTLLMKDSTHRPAAKRSFFALWMLLSPQDRKSELARQSFQAVPDDADESLHQSCPLPGILDAASPLARKENERLSTLEEAEKLIKTEPVNQHSQRTAKVKRSLVAVGPSVKEEQRQGREVSLQPKRKDTAASTQAASGISTTEEPAGGVFSTRGDMEAANPDPLVMEIRRPKAPASPGFFRGRLRRYVSAIQGTPGRVAKSVTGWRRPSPQSQHRDRSSGADARGPCHHVLPGQTEMKKELGGDACFSVVATPQQALQPQLPSEPLRARGRRPIQVAPAPNRPG